VNNDYYSMRRHESPKPEKTYEISDDGETLTRKAILVLEDDVDFGIQLQETLEMQGYAVTVVASGTDGLKNIMVGEYDAILCDMVMENFPGDMFYAAVERVRPQLCKRFIFMTGHQGDRKIEEFIRRIRGLMLWKPFKMDVLLETIRVLTKKNGPAEGRS
jgi:DNA-binding NtrC family response regulator